MTNQIQLDIRERISYSSTNFFKHSGVMDVFRSVDECLSSSEFRLLFIEGERRSGKTHAAITFTDLVMDRGQIPHLVYGSHLSEWLKGDRLTEAGFIIVDDIHVYLREMLPGNSGEFVRFVEHHRVLGSKLVLFSGSSIESLPCDEHVVSRLVPGSGLQLKPPADSEVSQLLFTMAKQRGMKLSERKLKFLSRRVSRDISSLEDYLDRVYRLSSMLGKSAHLPLLSDAL